MDKKEISKAFGLAEDAFKKLSSAIRPKKRIGEQYFLSVDFNEGDESVVLVTQVFGTKMVVIHTVTGKDAEELYEKMMNKKLEKENKNEQINDDKECSYQNCWTQQRFSNKV